MLRLVQKSARRMLPQHYTGDNFDIIQIANNISFDVKEVKHEMRNYVKTSTTDIMKINQLS